MTTLPVPVMLHSTNPLLPPTAHREVVPFTPLWRLAPNTRSPLVLRLNGQWVLRRQWDRPALPGDVIEWYELPQGGDGSRAVLQIVVTIIAIYVGYQIGGPWGGAAAAGINIAGSLAINALLPIQQPRLGGTGSMASPGSVYNVALSGNQARLGQPIPVIYGRMPVFPDYAAQPYVEYRDNDQYLHVVLCIGQGAYGDEGWCADAEEVA